MRRVFTAILAAASLAAGLAALPAPAAAGDRYGHDRGYDYGYDQRADCRCDHSRRGYWERPGDRRRAWNRHSHRRYRDSGAHYYPGYGYYADPPGYRGHHGRGDRSAWCARRYRSYDWRTGYYRGYDGRLHYCG